ncbi:hypothetical protein FPY71_03585 [Aureimonas fodinaquatilis]|uniref:Lipoprotein n=1 Tax=Aureimonas fodinaquatilis TaxID=2565783 RepID=A0A5B0DZH7_9HYPH|nr:hypothetical protein [Aureimonas fodinaquatilis]KAA0972204.1 hypothetical protein FPY71_03585 [Aureimonas fodinaquatilis]
MSIKNSRRTIQMALLGVSGLLVAGCVGPTYGTGATQGEQMLSDLDNIVAIGSTNKQSISYQPRPELVRPQNMTTLPAPREATSAANDPSWPVSPEVQRARRMAAAESTAGGAPLPADYRTGVAAPAGGNTRLNGEDNWVNPQDLTRQGQQVSQARATQYGVPGQRRYLSEPPVNYRQPSASAPVGDQGVDEDVKQRRAQGTKSLGAKIRDSLPF